MPGVRASGHLDRWRGFLRFLRKFRRPTPCPRRVLLYGAARTELGTRLGRRRLGRLYAEGRKARGRKVSRGGGRKRHRLGEPFFATRSSGGCAGGGERDDAGRGDGRCDGRSVRVEERRFEIGEITVPML